MATYPDADRAAEYERLMRQGSIFDPPTRRLPEAFGLRHPTRESRMRTRLFLRMRWSRRAVAVSAAAVVTVPAARLFAGGVLDLVA